MEKDLIENLPSDGVTGECRFSKSEKGYVNREIFIDVLKDLTDHLDRKSSAEQEKVESSLISPPGPSTRARPKGS